MNLRTVPPTIALAFMFVWMVMSLWWPLGRDQAAMAWCGHVWLHGGALYRDAWDIRGPACYFQCGLAEWLFGRHMWPMRLMDAAFLAIGMAGSAWLAAHVRSRAAGLWAAAFLGLWYARLGYGSTAEPEGWAAMLTVAGIAISVLRPAWWGFAVAGLLAGWVICLKPLFLVLWPAPLLAMRLRPNNCSDAVACRVPGRAVLSVSVYAAAAALVVALVAGSLALRGSVPEMLEILFRYTWEVYHKTAPHSLGRSVAGVVEFFLVHAPLVGLGVWALVRAGDLGGLRRVLLYWVWVGAGVVVAQNKFYPYHWTIVLVPLAVLAGCAVDGLFSPLQPCAGNAEGGGGRRGAAAVLPAAAISLLALLAAIPRPGRDLAAWAGYVLGQTGYAEFASAFGRWGERDFCYVAQRAVADYIASHSRRDDYVYIWGYGPLILYLTGRPCPSRFSFTHPLVASSLYSQYFWRKYKSELLRDLSRYRPRYFVVGDRDANLATPIDAAVFLGRFPGLQQVIRAHYVLETRIESFSIYVAVRPRSQAPQGR